MKNDREDSDEVKAAIDLLHQLWGIAQESPQYDKQLWGRLQEACSRVARLARERGLALAPCAHPESACLTISVEGTIVWCKHCGALAFGSTPAWNNPVVRNHGRR